MFICFEGIDGSGKTTQIKLLQEYLSQLSVEHIVVREPGGTKAGEEIRRILLHSDFRLQPESELLLFMAARAQIVREVIRPALEKGLVVLADRFMDSSLAYQGIGRELGVDEVKSINDFAISEVFPDLILFFDIDPIFTLKRKKIEFDYDRLENAGNSFHERVFAGYGEIIQKYPKNVKIINARNSIEEVLKDCIETITEVL